MLSLDKLRKPLTRKQALERIVEWLTSLGFDTTAWMEGSIEHTFITFMALMWSDLTEVAKALAEFGFNAHATGDALNEFSKSRYGHSKTPAVRERGTVRLTSTASVPYTIQVGELIAATDDGVQFRNLTGGTLNAGSTASPSTLDLTFEAVIAGSSSHVDNGKINRLLTPLAGVTCSNNVTSPWYSIVGADEESDASIRRRNATKWASLTVELVAESYEYIARNNGAVKVLVDDNNPRGAGTLDVYVASDRALLGVSTMEALQLAFSKAAFQTTSSWSDPWPGGDTSRVATKSPVPQPLNVTATLYHDGSNDDATVVANAEQAIKDFLTATPIGGWDYSPGPANVVKEEDLVNVLKTVDGVRSVTLTTPSGDISVGSTSLVTEGTFSLTAQKVG